MPLAAGLTFVLRRDIKQSRPFLKRYSLSVASGLAGYLATSGNTKLSCDYFQAWIGTPSALQVR
jgi:hypothetical protein